MENLGIDPSTSCMLSRRSTIWANSPTADFYVLQNVLWILHGYLHITKSTQVYVHIYKVIQLKIFKDSLNSSNV